ncbi:MAG: glycosyltransferase family 4 protein [Arenicellales bacterium]|nr:glycosyltransferase family 4 protein [Arenicellales bacterium]
MKVLFFANSDWYLYNFRLSLARYMSDLGHEVVLVSPPGLYSKRLEALGFRWRSLEMERQSLNLFKELRVIYRLLRIYRSERPDIAHHFTLKCVLYGMFAVSVSRVSSSVNAITGLGHLFTVNSRLSRLLKPLVPLVLKLLFLQKRTRVIVQNRDDYEFVKMSRIIDERELYLIYGSGVNTDLFVPFEREKNRKITILMATRLLEDKGVKEYLQAAQSLGRRKEEVIFQLAGERDLGNPSSFTESEVTAWEEEGDVMLLGQVEDMAGLLKRVDIVVLPSYREGLPRILIEAGACALPIVTTDVPGCREVVEDGVNGFLVPPRDVVVLSEKIEMLLDSYSLRRKFGEAGREKILNQFDEGIVLPATAKTYLW